MSHKDFLNNMYQQYRKDQNNWVSKKYVMEKEPLNEDLYDWGQAEDVDWSKRVREKYKYVMNDFSSVQSLKYKNIRAEVLK